MDKIKLLFVIDAEQQLTCISRILSLFSRKRINIHHLSSQLKQEEQTLQVMITVSESKENGIKISRQLNREVDVINVNVFEQLN